jgi:hypothetical protein
VSGKVLLGGEYQTEELCTRFALMQMEHWKKRSKNVSWRCEKGRQDGKR